MAYMSFDQSGHTQDNAVQHLQVASIGQFIAVSDADLSRDANLMAAVRLPSRCAGAKNASVARQSGQLPKILPVEN